MSARLEVIEGSQVPVATGEAASCHDDVGQNAVGRQTNVVPMGTHLERGGSSMRWVCFVRLEEVCESGCV